jgi:hypothetical protein
MIIVDLWSNFYTEYLQDMKQELYALYHDVKYMYTFQTHNKNNT